MEKHELSKTDFDTIDAALQALLKSNPTPRQPGKSPNCATCFRTPTPAGWKSNKRRPKSSRWGRAIGGNTYCIQSRRCETLRQGSRRA